jgi:hypothetical protein
MIESVETLRNSTDRGGGLEKFKACSQRLQFMKESVETLRNSTDREQSLRAVVRDYSL